MHNLLLPRQTWTVPRATCVGVVCALGALTALVAPGCKAKLSKHGPDASDPAAPVARKATPSQLARAVTNYLTANVTRTHRSGGEQLIAFDRLRGKPTISPDGAEMSFRSQARVFVRTPSGEDQTRIERIRCSLQQAAAGWTIQACKVGPTLIKSTPVHTTPHDGGHLGADRIGVPECDELIRFHKCFQKNVPAASRAAMSKGYRNMVQSLRKAAANPATRKTIAKTCTMVLKTMRKSAHNIPMYKGCI